MSLPIFEIDKKIENVLKLIFIYNLKLFWAKFKVLKIIKILWIRYAQLIRIS